MRAGGTDKIAIAGLIAPIVRIAKNAVTARNSAKSVSSALIDKARRHRLTTPTAAQTVLNSVHGLIKTSPDRSNRNPK